MHQNSFQKTKIKRFFENVNLEEDMHKIKDCFTELLDDSVIKSVGSMQFLGYEGGLDHHNSFKGRWWTIIKKAFEESGSKKFEHILHFLNDKSVVGIDEVGKRFGKKSMMYKTYNKIVKITQEIIVCVVVYTNEVSISKISGCCNRVEKLGFRRLSSNIERYTYVSDDIYTIQYFISESKLREIIDED